MAVPKHKASKKQSGSRYSANSALESVAIGECPQCHEHKLNHRVCPNCGYYDGVKRIDIREKKD